MPFTVFYAWQSDRPEKVCRYFIRDAAEAAVKRVAKEYAVDDAPAFDHATEGESGLVHIADTIKRKIRDCGAIIADLTHVAEYTTAGDEPRPKRATNANVAIEFGYAMHVLHPRQIILVMNTAFGPPEDLPFDLKHYSFPIQYTLESPDDPNKATVKKQLTDQIATAIKRLIDSGALEGRGKDERERQAAAETAARQRAQQAYDSFEEEVGYGHFHDFDASDSYLTFAMIPLDFTGVVAATTAPDPYNNLFLTRTPSDHSRRADHVRVIRRVEAGLANGNLRVEAVVVLDRHGRIFAAERVDRIQRQGDTNNIANWVGCERGLINAGTRYTALLRHLGVTGRIHAQFALHKVKGCELIAGMKRLISGPFDRSDDPDVTPPPSVIAASVAGTDEQATAAAFRDGFDWAWRSVGAVKGCLYFDANGLYDRNAE